MDRVVRFFPVFAVLFLLAACSSLSPDVEPAYPGAHAGGGYSSSGQSFPAEKLADDEICVGAWCNCDAY